VTKNKEINTNQPRFVAYVKHGGRRVYLTSATTEKAAREQAMDAVNPLLAENVEIVPIREADEATKDWFGLLN
jgi:hypothetical protein